MAKFRAGWERQVLYDNTAGSTATTQLTHIVDCNITKTKERTDATDRGDGSAIPRNHQIVVQRNCEVTFTYRYYDSDTAVNNLIAHAEAGTAFALKVVRINSGTTEFDGDVTVDLDHPGALTDGQTISFTCTPTNEAGRDWSDT